MAEYQPINSSFPNMFRARTTFVVRTLLPIADEQQVGFENLHSFIETYKIAQRRLPDEMIPIASDPFGNLFCLAVEGDDAGKVLFWDHEREPDDDEEEVTSFPNVRFVADSFEEFLASLEPL